MDGEENNNIENSPGVEGSQMEAGSSRQDSPGSAHEMEDDQVEELASVQDAGAQE